MNNHERAKRGDVGGWSYSSIRSNTRFLYSVDDASLTGLGWALTLTVRDCPASHDEWHKIRRSFVKRLERMGMIRMHWVTEWQRRGVPHLHCAVWFPPPRVAQGKTLTAATLEQKATIIGHWLSVAGHNGASSYRGQHIAPITEAVGWFKYLSKHASRGLHHYQRSPEGIPDGWKKTGRMWGYLGDWPLRDVMELALDQEGYHAFRRIVRSYRISNARHSLRTANTPLAAKQARRRITQARGMLTCHKRELSAVRGVSEWIEVKDQIRMVAAVAAMGYRVEQN